MLAALVGACRMKLDRRWFEDPMRFHILVFKISPPPDTGAVHLFLGD